MTYTFTNLTKFSKSFFPLLLLFTSLTIGISWTLGYRPIILAVVSGLGIATLLGLFCAPFPLWVLTSIVVTFLDNVYFFPSLSSFIGNIPIYGLFFILVSLSFLFFLFSPFASGFSFRQSILEYLIAGYLLYCFVILVAGLTKYDLISSLSEGFWGAYACVFIFFGGIAIRVYSSTFMLKFIYGMLIVMLFALFFKVAYWHQVGRYEVYVRMTGPFVQYFILLALLTVQRHVTLKKIPGWEYIIYPALFFFAGISRVRIFIFTVALSLPVLIAIDYFVCKPAERKGFLRRLLRLAITILPFIVVGIVVSSILIPGFLEMTLGRFKLISTGKLDESGFARIAEIMYSVKILKQTSWLWGSGFGTPPYILLPSHDNAFAFLAPYVGLFGFTYLTIIWIVAVCLGFKLLKKINKIPVYERMFLPPIVIFLLGCIPYGLFQKSYPRPAVAFIGSFCMAMISYWHGLVKNSSPLDKTEIKECN